MTVTNLFRRRKQLYILEEFLKRLEEAKQCCMLETLDIILVNEHRTNGVKILEDIALRMDVEYIDPVHTISLVWCSLSCVQYFHFSITTRECASNKIPRKKRLKLQKAFKTFSIIINKLSKFSKSVHASVLTYLTDASLWNTESLSANIIKKLMVNPERSVQTISSILNTLEKNHLGNEHQGRVIVRVLCRVLENYNWTHFNIEMMNKILTMFYHSVKSEEDTRYVPWKRGLEICIKTLIKNVANQHILMIIDILIDWVLESDADEPVYDFGTILQFASVKHQVNYYFESLTHKLFSNIIRLIESPNCVCSLLGHKMFQNLLDRKENAKFMAVPRIFFIDLKYGVNIQNLNNEDVIFIKKYRIPLHHCIMACVKQHGKHRGIVESIFTTLALLVVEIKCGMTAAVVVCIVMSIQEYVLSPEYKEQLITAHRIHAIVMAILSLICWVHQATVFYDYVYTVMKWRSSEAPYLNPPLKSRYQYALNHILWNKKELFFEDWEVRYGIWNCFRNFEVTFLDHQISALNILKIVRK